MNTKKELKWPEYQVIKVKNTLGKKALVPGNPADAIERATRKAESAVHQLSAQFPAWMQGESNRLHGVRLELADKGHSLELIDRLFTCSHDIKGQAQTFGYPVAGVIGKLLCDLIERAPDPSQIPLAVIDQHVDTIRAIVRHDIKGDGNAQTTNIIEGLNVLVHTTLKKITAAKPIAQAG